MTCVGVYGEGCFRPGEYVSGRCATCYRSWMRHQKPAASNEEAAFDALVTAVDKYMNSDAVSDEKLKERKAIIDLCVSHYAPLVLGADKVKKLLNRRVSRATFAKSFSVEEVIGIIHQMSRDDRRRVYRSIVKLPPEVARERRAAAARARGLQCSKEFLREIGKRGNATRWGKAPKPDA